MSIITDQDQSQVDQCAREHELRKQYRELASLGLLNLDGMKTAIKLSRERTDRLEKLIMVAIMELSLGNTRRAQEVLNQAITS